MPRIDPAQLLKTLGVLLAPHGGIKSSEEVAIMLESTSSIKSLALRNTRKSFIVLNLLGRPARSIDAKVFQETRIKGYLRQNIEVLFNRID